jgi:hypothetical protein
MATLREYFDTDFKCMTTHADWTVGDSTGKTVATVRAKISQEFDANAKYWSFFVADAPDVISSVEAILNCKQTEECVLSADGDTMYIESGFADYSERATSATLVFTRRVFLYIDAALGEGKRKEITDYGLTKGFHVIVRDRDYAEARSRLEKPLAFISHDTRDKESLVRELALEMSKLMCPVWYDEYSLKVGDSLRASIERGLKETKKCVVVLSPHFLSNEGWGKAEFDSIFTREILEKQNVILPVWHNVGSSEVYQYSPRLADKVGLDSAMGVPELARRLVSAIK